MPPESAGGGSGGNPSKREFAMHQLSEETRAEVAEAIVNLRVFVRIYTAIHPEAVSPVMAAHAGRVLAGYATCFESIAPLLGISHADLFNILEEKREDWLAKHGPTNQLEEE